MKEYVGDIWRWGRLQKPIDKTAIVIPTNGTVKVNGECVMGAGLAKQVVEKYPTFPMLLGMGITNSGNRAMWFQREGVLTFPVKHKWFEHANLALIARSCRQINRLIELHGLVNIGMPHVGCGNGKLSWEDVGPIVRALLDGRCTIITER